MPLPHLSSVLTSTLLAQFWAPPKGSSGTRDNLPHSYSTLVLPPHFDKEKSGLLVNNNLSNDLLLPSWAGTEPVR